MYIVGVSDSYTLSLPLTILTLLAADFDGDVLNILYIINKDFAEAAARVFNPRNAFYVSRNDGKMNSDVLYTKDTMVNANALIGLSRPYYTAEQLERIRQCQNCK